MYTNPQQAREEMVALVQELYQARLITSTGGNVSVRLAGSHQGTFLITPTGMHKGGLQPQDMVHIDHQGSPLPGEGQPSVETPMHLAIYQAYPEVHAVVHTHAPLAIALGLVEGRIPPITVDAVAFQHLHIVPYALPGDADLIQQVVKGLEACPVVLLQNHGVVAVGASLREAAHRTMALEETIHILLACRLLGREPVELSPHWIDAIRRAGVV